MRDVVIISQKEHECHQNECKALCIVTERLNFVHPLFLPFHHGFSHSKVQLSLCAHDQQAIKPMASRYFTILFTRVDIYNQPNFNLKLLLMHGLLK